MTEATDPDDPGIAEPASPSWLARPCLSLRYISYCRIYALATANRLTLPDATAEEWLVPAAVHLLGAALLAINGSFAGWVLCTVGAAAPLLFLKDQLTQSVFLLGCAAGGVACWLGSRAGRRARLEHGFPFVVRVLVVGVYASAALHKLNRDFFTPAVSCANGGLTVLAEQWGAPVVDRVAMSGAWPPMFVLAELSVAVLFVVRPGFAICGAMLLHLPLTIIFAPAFAFTMMSGWIMFFGDEELRHFGRSARAHWASILVIGGGPAALSLWRHTPERWSVDPDWCLKEAVLWLVAAAIVVAWVVPRTPRVFGWWSAWRERPGKAGSRIGVALGVLWGVNALSPYSGLHFHHAAAMLSNLRIDEGCWNSFVFPESLRVHEPYVRIDSVTLGDAGREAEARERLWTHETLATARRRWCRNRTEPLAVAGTWRGGAFAIPSFCSDEGWPFGQPLLAGFRPYQVNLTRNCPQACVH